MKIIEFIKKSIDSICAKYIEGNIDEKIIDYVLVSYTLKVYIICTVEY